jgi:crossover junction endodeoxyribonuclease RusA
LSACFTNAPGKGRVPTKRYKAWTAESLWSLKAQKPRQFEGEVSIYVALVSPDRRTRDAGNCDKAIMDVLVKAGIIKDDSNRYVKRVTYEWRVEGEPCVVLINEFEGAAA